MKVDRLTANKCTSQLIWHVLSGQIIPDDQAKIIYSRDKFSRKSEGTIYIRSKTTE